MEALTLDQVRDSVAELLGWTPYTASNGVVVWSRGEPGIDYEHQIAHPIDGTIDGIAALWKEHAKGWKCRLTITAAGCCYGYASETGGEYREVHADTGSELETRLHLLRACLLAGGGG